MAQAIKIPAQEQNSMPAKEHEMHPAPDYKPRHAGVGKLKDKVAFIAGADSGIGRAIAALYAREGAKIAIAYFNEDKDAQETKRIVEQEEGGEVILIKGDLSNRDHAFDAVQQCVDHFGGLNIVINNGAVQYLDDEFEGLDDEKLRRTIDNNIYSYMYVTQAALDHLSEGDSIINTSSVNAFAGMGSLVTYSTTKGANLAFSRSMAQQLADRKIRVNAVAPGPIWTPFIPGTMPAEKVEDFGSDMVPMGRPGQPWEVATCYLFLASSDGNYFTGQTLHPNGGMIVGA